MSLPTNPRDVLILDPRECLDDMRVALVVDGTAPPAAVAHAARCAACRGRIAEVATAASERAVAAEIARLDGRPAPWVRRAVGIGGLVAAAALAFAVAGQGPRDDDRAGDAHRDIPVAAPAVPAPIVPDGGLAAQPVALRWRAAAGASQYRVAVFDVEGSVVWEHETGDTVAVIPAAAGLAAGRASWWRVEARVGFDRWTRSDVTPFTVDGQTARFESTQARER